MSKKFQLTESEKKQIKSLYLFEEPKKGDTKFCHKGNVKTLEEITGDDEMEDYVEGIQIRKNGLGAIIDRLELLKANRLLGKVSDDGKHAAFQIMNQLKSYKPYNYFEETTKECRGAMDKIIELYKENEHGEELVKDIEKVYGMTYKNPETKEYLKHILNMVKGS